MSTENSREIEIKGLLQQALAREYFSRIQMGSIIFILVSTFYGLDGLQVHENVFVFKVLCGFGVIASILRLIVTQKSLNRTEISIKATTWSQVMTVCLGIVMSAIHSIGLIESGERTYVFAFIATVSAAFAAGSIINHCIFSFSAILYQIFNMIPLWIYGYWQFQVTSELRMLSLPGLFLVFLIVGIAQTLGLGRGIRNRFRSEIELRFVVTDLKESQDQVLEQTKKMVHSARLASLGEMAGGIAHEVNNPLAVILGHVQQLERLATEKRPIEDGYLIEKLKKIALAVERISKIIKGLRQFSQQADSEPMVPAQVSKIIEETVDMCGEKFKNHGIDFNIDCKDNGTIMCRPVQVSQILINLLNNAFDSISEHEEKGSISLKCEKDENQIRIRIVNSGPGIPALVKVRLFQPFFTTKEVGKGTGLGLSISKGIAQEHGGDLTLLEGMDQTTFELRLPLKPA